LFYHSVLSDWNHGNAHFLRGIARELSRLGHDVTVYEPVDAWSARHLVADHGTKALFAMRQVYPTIRCVRYDEHTLDLDEVLAGVELTIVHEWNSPALVRRIGCYHRMHSGGVLLFHDTHHRSVSSPEEIASYDLSGYDGVLAFGEVIRQRYIDIGWAQRAYTWHEAADATLFRPVPGIRPSGDLVWIGNWGDGERAREIDEYLLTPIERLHLRTTIHGVRYPDEALAAVHRSGATYAGWLPNYDVPRTFAAHRVTVHIPRRPYVRALPGIPTIRVFEALACGIPLISAPWDDVEGLFLPGVDFLVAETGADMERLLCDVLCDTELATAIASSGRDTILARHTCGHRVRELLAIHESIRAGSVLAEVKV